MTIKCNNLIRYEVDTSRVILPTHFSKDSFGIVFTSNRTCITQIRKEKVLKPLNLENEDLE